MSDSKDGKYVIKSVAGRRPIVGVDLSGSPVVPVITGGSNNHWTITKLPDGNYTLVLDNFATTVFIQDDGGNLVGSQTSPPSVWTIERQADGSCTILVASPTRPTRGWTLNNDQPGNPVVLSIVENPQDNQKWDLSGGWPGQE